MASFDQLHARRESLNQRHRIVTEVRRLALQAKAAGDQGLADRLQAIAAAEQRRIRAAQGRLIIACKREIRRRGLAARQPRTRPPNRSAGDTRVTRASPRRRRSAGPRKKAAADPEPSGESLSLGWLLSPLMNPDGTLAVVPPDAIAERVLKRSTLWPLIGSSTRWTLRQLFRARPFTPADAEAIDRVIACTTGCRLPGRGWWPAISGPIPALALLVRVEGIWRIVTTDVEEDCAATFSTRGSA